MTEDVLVVVAAGPGLGRSVALRFAREGVAVGLVARPTDRLADLAAELSAAGARSVATAAADVGDAPSLRAAMGALRSELGPATVLVYNGSAYVEGRTDGVVGRAAAAGARRRRGRRPGGGPGGRARDARRRPRDDRADRQRGGGPGVHQRRGCRRREGGAAQPGAVAAQGAGTPTGSGRSP